MKFQFLSDLRDIKGSMGNHRSNKGNCFSHFDFLIILDVIIKESLIFGIVQVLLMKMAAPPMEMCSN